MDTSILNLLFSICIGIGLSASCGFRVFVPLLVTSIAAHTGAVPLADNMLWLGSWTAIICLGTATLLEIAAYYFPWFDHALDVAATPLALVAGAVLTASVLTGMDPVWQWGLGIIVGSGSAGITQASTTTLRLGSTAATAGFGNPFVATFEYILALLGSLLALWLPILSALIFVIFASIILYLFFKKSNKKPDTPA